MRPLLFAVAMSMASCALAQDAATEDGGVAPVWVAQKEATRAFRFSVLSTQIDESTAAPLGLRIHDRRTGALVQEFKNIDGLDAWGDADGLVRLVDANFDGHPDISLALSRGGAGPNNTSYFYLYNPATGRFEMEKTLSSLTQVSINPDRTISSGARGGCCTHERSRYRYVGKRLTLVFTETRQWIDENKVRVSTGRLVNGKMKYVTRMVKE